MRRESSKRERPDNQPGQRKRRKITRQRKVDEEDEEDNEEDEEDEENEEDEEERQRSSSAWNFEINQCAPNRTCLRDRWDREGPQPEQKQLGHCLVIFTGPWTF